MSKSAPAIPADRDRAMEGLDVLIQIIGSPAYFFDMESHKLLSVNRPFAELMEYEESELLDMTVADLRPAEEVPKLLRALKQSPPQGTVEWRYRTRTGGILHVRISYRNSLYFDKVNGRRHEIRLVVVSSWDRQNVRSSDELFG